MSNTIDKIKYMFIIKVTNNMYFSFKVITFNQINLFCLSNIYCSSLFFFFYNRKLNNNFNENNAFCFTQICVTYIIYNFIIQKVIKL